MRNILLTMVLLLVTTIGYSQRNFTMGVQYNSKNVMVNDFDIKLSYWINSKDKFIIEMEGTAYSYYIESEIKGATVSGYKYITYTLTPDNYSDKPKQIQVFEDKQYGIRMYITGSEYYYQFYD